MMFTVFDIFINWIGLSPGGSSTVQYSTLQYSTL